jgi:hypothetical protein
MKTLRCLSPTKLFRLIALFLAQTHVADVVNENGTPRGAVRD